MSKQLRKSSDPGNMLFLSLILLPLASGGLLRSLSDLMKGVVPKEKERVIPEMSVPELIRYWGYPVEEHHVVTEDGYILGLHRIPHGRASPNSSAAPRPVVYLQHCLGCSSAIWSWGPPSKSLGMLLADEGYDVWMGNSRGNTYSRNHTTLPVCSTARCKEFWDFDWHEGGLYDVTAGVDYALNVTGEETLDYVGHSMGCTQYLVMLSQRPQYNKKIRLGALLAPPAFMTHANSPLFLVARLAGDIQYLYHLLGHYEFLPHTEVVSWFGRMFCSELHLHYQEICDNIGMVMLGFNPDQLNETMIPTYMDHFPEGTSTRTFAHYVQLYFSGRFEGYDFGKNGNLKHYGSESPPSYDLTKVEAPTAIFKADADTLSSLPDIDHLVSLLPNVIFDHQVQREGWTHLDYVAAMDADKMVYDLIIGLFRQHNLFFPFR